ncbi:uncharacterized protein LOC117644483 [Thrips palmi]|uniref:Uncharacterized protein LOC117644483 n=1 Tax=Thrips palmi TaxID=161013 RepID=A0A6P8YRC4_THRPL|nr:uncharacterized protein LOC117644483 [Thrips palmi]XP_034239885.1 uncharacterized protein LOC117644483 [Thrips palmi]XP_034239886.1 uncharacterized protein LOC117644483 [Thrips palmi]
MAVAVDSNSCQPCVNDRKLWEPVIAAECFVPWDVIRMLDPYKERVDFFGPFPVHANENDTYDDNELFSIRFHSTGKWIKVGLQRNCLKQPWRELLVKSCGLWTKRESGNEPFNQNPLTWPLPEEKNSVHIVDKNGNNYYSRDTTEGTLMQMPQCTTRCFTVRLEVYGRRVTPTDSLINSLNLARKSGSSLCDVQLRVDGHVYPAHKAVLSATSSVFMAMFTGEFKEKTAETVIIEGASKEAFGRFLDFLYTEDIASWDGCELELLDLSERYQVERLKARCEMCLWGLDGPRALSLLMEADKWPVVTPAIKNRLCRLVAAGWRAVADSDEWQALQASNPVTSGIIQAFAAIVAPSVKVFKRT